MSCVSVQGTTGWTSEGVENAGRTEADAERVCRILQQLSTTVFIYGVLAFEVSLRFLGRRPDSSYQYTTMDGLRKGPHGCCPAHAH